MPPTPQHRRLPWLVPILGFLLALLLLSRLNRNDDCGRLQDGIARAQDNEHNDETSLESAYDLDERSVDDANIGAHRELELPPKAYQKLKSHIEEYSRLHADILERNVADGKHIVWYCGDACSEWGNRMQGIFTTLILSMIHNRTFLVSFGREQQPLSDFYQPELINWDAQPPSESHYAIDCNDCACIMSKIRSSEFKSALVTKIHANVDCSSELSNAFPDWVKRSGVGHLDNAWHGILMDSFFPLGIQTVDVIDRTVPIIPIVGMDAQLTSNQENVRSGEVKAYEKCFDLVIRGAPSAFMAVSEERILADFINALRSKTNVYSAFGSTKVVEDRKAVSKLNPIWRGVVNFEVLRRVPVLLVSRSALSKFIYKLRVLPDARAYAAFDGCKRISHADRFY